MPIQQITSGVIADGAVVADIADGTVTGPKLGTNSVSSNNIIAGVTLTTPIISGNLNLDSAGTTGVRVPSANTLAFYEGGVEAMRIDSAGNIGIGTANPGQRLEVLKAGGGAIRISETASRYVEINGYGEGSANGSVMDFNTITAGTSTLTQRGRFDNAGNFLFNSGYGSVAVAYGCRAWVNFNGTGTVAIRGSGNVSSITDNGTGNYFINFASALTDANYSVTGIGGHIVGVVTTFSSVREGTRTTSGVQVDYFTVSSTYYDTNDANIAVFR